MPALGHYGVFGHLVPRTHCPAPVCISHFGGSPVDVSRGAVCHRYEERLLPAFLQSSASLSHHVTNLWTKEIVDVHFRGPGNAEGDCTVVRTGVPSSRSCLSDGRKNRRGFPFLLPPLTLLAGEKK